MSAARALDHVGIAGRDLAALAARVSALGFTLTPAARHAGRGTGNRCAMLRDGYIELIAVVDPAQPSESLDRMLARHPGIHIVALGMDDADANLARLHAGGLAIPGVVDLRRPVDDAAPDGPMAQFALLPLPDAPEGRLQLIRHLTPEALWQPRFTTHANHAVGLEWVALFSDTPAESAARFARLAGVPLGPDPVGGYRLALAQGAVRILPHGALDAVFPGAVAPPLPWFAGIALATDDGAAAAAKVPGARKVPGGVLTEAGGAFILFCP